MFSHGKLILRFDFKNVFHRYQSQTSGLENHLMSIANSSFGQGYSIQFFNEEVQKLLKKISNIDLQKVFKPKPLGEKLMSPVYELLSNEELETKLNEAKQKAEYLLQIPPLVNITKDEIQILEENTSLDGYDKHHSKHVFVDISYNETNNGRVIVVREPNGILRTASKNERYRMNQIYSPVSGRELETPEMFETEHLMNVIKRKEYEFILDRACTQFEPEDLNYHKVITLTYEAINYCRDFDVLHSTRHFGSLAFYLVTHKNIDNMVDDNIQKDRINDAFSLIKLYHIIHPNCKSAKLSNGKTDIEILKDFINFDSKTPSILNKTLENYLKKEQIKNKIENEIKEAHGL